MRALKNPKPRSKRNPKWREHAKQQAESITRSFRTASRSGDREGARRAMRQFTNLFRAAAARIGSEERGR